MGESKKLLKEVYKLIIESESILKEDLNYESNINEISIDESNDVIIIEDQFGKLFQYNLSDSYTSLIKVIKFCKNENIINNYKRLKEISLYMELL